MRRPNFLPAFILLLCAAPALGQTPYRVADINPDFKSGGSQPEYLTTLGDVSIFIAEDGVTGREMWRSDGTATGTYPLVDACEGICNGNPGILGVAGGRAFLILSEIEYGQGSLWVTDGTRLGTFRLTEGVHVLLTWPPRWVQALHLFFFLADDGAHGSELWRSNGTAAGTFQVADIRPGAEGSNPRWLTSFAGKLFFAADDGLQGRSLWRSDGTRAGTRLIKDVLPGSASQAGPSFIAPVGGRLLFFVSGVDRYSLWKSNGTPGGTVRVTDLLSRSAIPHLDDLTIVGNRVFFVAEIGKSGQELWTSDGTAAGTRALTHFSNPAAFISPLNTATLYLPWVSLGSRLVFPVDDGLHGQEMWVSDGTVAGTRLLRDTCAGKCSGGGFVPYPFRGRLFYPAYDGAHGSELWATDGTAAGTSMVRDLCPGSCGSQLLGLISRGDRLLFVGDDGISGKQVWRSDGTAAGTVRVSDLPNVPNGWRSFGESAVPAGVLFTFDDPVTGHELWRTDGTPAGTNLVRDINDANYAGSFPAILPSALGDQILFFAGDGLRRGLWKSDGTAGGTSFLSDLSLSAESLGSAKAGGLLFLVLRNPVSADDTALWRMDGTAAGTVRLTPPELRVSGEIRAVGATVYFTASDENGRDLWKSDGTAVGTVRVRNLGPGEYTGDPRNLATLHGRLFLTLSDGETGGRMLWSSDGTPQGTLPVKLIRTDSQEDRIGFVEHAGRLWFSGNDEAHGRELWSSDGTSAGTALALDLVPGRDSFGPSGLISAGGRLFLFGSGGLFVSDGTAAGTQWIAGVQGIPGDATEFHGDLYFTGLDNTLWRSDGTAAGTRQVGQALNSSPSLSALGDRLYWIDRDARLWKSDGTEAGSAPVHEPLDLKAQGPLVRAGQRLFFQGYDPAAGFELWAIGPP